MARRVYEPPRPRPPWAWGGAIVLLGTLTAGLIGAAILLWHFVDIDSLLEAAEDPPPAVEQPVPDLRLPDLTLTGPWAAHVYESQRSATFFPDSTYLADLIGRWDSLLATVGAATTHLTTPASIDSLRENALLVIPSALCLDDRERQAIRRYVRRGGHLLASWALGARDGECEWVGFDLLRRLVGAESAGTVAKAPVAYLVAPRSGVLAAGFPPGSRIELRTEGWTTVRSDYSGIFWSDWALNPLSAPGGGAAGAAVTRVSESGARIAWLGYRIDAAASPRDQRPLGRLAQNAALWAAGHVIADLDPWPDGHRAALSVTQDVEHSFRNSRRLAERFRAIDVPVTFFVVTQLALERPELAPLLRSAGEVGSHGVDHRQVAGRLWGNQLAGARKAHADIASWCGAEPLGFRPPRELYDQATLEAWRRQGGLYLAASNGARSAAPEVLETQSGPLVVLPRVVDDDYSVMVMRGQRSHEALQTALLNALEKIRWLGGLDLITLHSQLIDTDRRVTAVETAVNAAREAGDVWIARASDIAEWWLARSELELVVRERPDRSVMLTVRNNGAEAVSSARLRLYLAEDGSRYAAPELGDEILDSDYGPFGQWVMLPEVASGDSLAILLPRRGVAPAP